MSEFVSIEHPDDEKIEVYVGGELVASANHDEHGWSGMDAVERTALAVGRATARQALIDYRDANHRHNDRAPGWCVCGDEWDDAEDLRCAEYEGLTEAASAPIGGEPRG